VLISHVSGLLGVAAVTWLLGVTFGRLHLASIAMVYFLLVVMLAVVFGSGPAIAAAVLAFLAFNWFFVEPVGSFTVQDLDDWVALGLFLVVAVITGHLAAALRRREAEVQRRATELATLNELSGALLAGTHARHALRTIADRMVSVLGRSYCVIYTADQDGRLVEAAAAGVVPPQVVAMAGARCVPLTETRAALEEASPAGPRHVPLRTGDRALGVLVAGSSTDGSSSPTDAERLLRAFADQAILALERDRLAAEERRASVLEESDRVKGALLSSVSHELRTPLAVIRGAAGGLLQANLPWPDPAHRDLAVTIDREAERLDHLVGNLLDMSRIEAGVLRPEVSAQAIDEAIGAVLDRLQPLLARHRLEITLPDALPLAPFDPLQIDRVLTNLLENAGKFAPDETVISLRVTVVADELRVSIENQGPPLTPEEEAHIFDKFYQGRDHVLGSGLGLAISKGIVEAHGGRIWAENLPAGGVRFTFTLSLAASGGRGRGSG
jgi:two-component system sensor histidine kinase KdpD